METVLLSREIDNKIKRVSKILGISKDTFTLRAVLFYLQSVKNKIDLKKELDSWEKASDHDQLDLDRY